MKEEMIRKAYEMAREVYAGFGIDTDAAIGRSNDIDISIPCWQGDDVTGFEKSGESLSGGIMATGGYPGRARTGEELRADMERAMSLVPGKLKANVHAMYMESERKVERDEIEPEHFEKWVEWAKAKGYGLDFNPSSFSHPKAVSGYTLSDLNKEIRDFWVEHCIRTREIAEYMGRATGKTCINNLWIQDGSKDLTPLRLKRRELLLESCERIYRKNYSKKHLMDAVECKLFGIASESFVVGSHEFYLGYAAKKGLLITFDMGHFHPTESIADKISSSLFFVPGILIHISRGVRWDSDHIAVLNDDLVALMQEAKRADAFDRVYFSLDFFDASVNRLFAWVIGARAARKALLYALLEPTELLVQAETDGDYGKRLALIEEFKNLPWQAVFDMSCLKQGMPAGAGWIETLKEYEAQVLSRR